MPTPLEITVGTELVGLVDLDQYMGLWAVESTRFSASLDYVAGMDLVAHVRAYVPATRQVGQRAADDDSAIAVIPIEGTLTKRGSSLSSASSLIALRRAVRTAADDSAIKAILLKVDSPGGTVAGTQDLVDAVTQAGQQKPVWAFVEDLAASAGLWIPSAAAKIYANAPTAIIGSIGTYMVLYDLSKAADKRGIKAIVVSTGSLKGASVPGVEVSDELVEMWQGLVEETQAQFSAGIAAGRKMSSERVAELATGRVWTAPEAQKLGLIDGIQSYEQTLADLHGLISQSQTRMTRSQRMADTPQPATLEEVRTFCPGASAEWMVSQLDKKATVDQVRSNWNDEQTRLLEEAKKETAAKQTELDEANVKAAEAEKTAIAKSKHSGVPAVGSQPAGPAGNGADAGDFSQLVRDRMKNGGTRMDAVKAVAKSNPEAHKLYLLATNPSRRKIQDAIEDRFEE